MAEVKVFDNGKTGCRELWVDGVIIYALSNEAVTIAEGGERLPTNLYEMVLDFAPWKDNKIHFSTTGENNGTQTETQTGLP